MRGVEREVKCVTEQIEGSVRRLYEAKSEFRKAEDYYDKVKKKESVAISNFMFSNMPGENGFDITLSEGYTYYDNPKKLHVTRARRKKVVWNVEMLKERLSKDKRKAVIKKEYAIADIDGLVSYLKSCGVAPKKFKSFLNVTETVDEKTLNNLFDVGVVTKTDVKGCYDIEMSEPYIVITECKNGTLV